MFVSCHRDISTSFFIADTSSDEVYRIYGNSVHIVHTVFLYGQGYKNLVSLAVSTL